MRRNCDLCLRRFSQVCRTVPPLSTPAPEQSRASPGIHPSSSYASSHMQWGCWVTHRTRFLEPQNTGGAMQARETGGTGLGRGLGSACAKAWAAQCILIA